MKNIRLIFIIILATCGEIIAQESVKVDYIWSKLKCEFPPLSPLPAEKTYDIELPDGLTYLTNRDEVRPYWSPYGLILVNEWDTKNPAAYTFKMEIEGIKLTGTQNIKKPSQTSVTGYEFLREYSFGCPSNLIIVDNSTQEVIKTIPIILSDESFTRTLHKNLFVASPLDPNYNVIVGFDSLAQLTRIPEEDSKVLKKIEGEFASEVFEKMKTALVHLYGKAELRADFAVLNPKKKKRPFDYSDYDVASEKLEKAFEAINTNITEESAYASTLEDAETFYSTSAQKDGVKFSGLIPAMVFWNLTEINLINKDFKSAEENFNRFKAADWPKYHYFSTMLEPAYLTTLEFLKAREALRKY